ncbi:MAG TPA: MBL fold metallo-hydrolase [Candidatus Binatia bacterium]
MPKRLLSRILIGVAALLALAVLALGAVLVQAHRAIDRERAPLPTADDLARFRAEPASALPVRLWWVETASQRMPRTAVLEPNEDPTPARPYVMSHPAFVLEWADGRVLLIDAGMRREPALEFGRQIEWLGGARPLVARGAIGAVLGPSAARVRGIVFTHLHTDHVDGVLSLCAAAPETRLTAFMTEAQSARPNHTTRPGLALLDEATCVERATLSGERFLAVPGFPGVAVIDAGGHTPGSQIVLARVATEGGERLYAFAGDTVNHLDGILHDVPKPWLYRKLLVPESDARQKELRAFLATLAREHGARLLVSHDQVNLRAELGPATTRTPRSAPRSDATSSTS